MTSLAPEPLPSASLDDIARNRPIELRASEWAVYALRTAMDAGVLTPATQLTEEALAATLDVSRNTLRQAFTELEGQNLVQRIPTAGFLWPAPIARRCESFLLSGGQCRRPPLTWLPLGRIRTPGPPSRVQGQPGMRGRWTVWPTPTRIFTGLWLRLPGQSG